ncbi:MAG: HAMP domain-containing histidine kinase [Lachnospiraceae bacterium]|nr:HAMP domain-containing histidine kinase [Lachnospiraceae bacterium]
MKANTVTRRIFRSNTFMVIVMLVAWMLINALFVKGYWEFVERELANSAESVLAAEDIEELVREFTMRRNEFLLLFAADCVLCVGVLILVSRFFTSNLTAHIMEPLQALAEGAERVRNGELTQPITYRGAAEFENVCDTFNDMQSHILEEREKNRKYEKARTDMIAGISHDLRTPLTAVRGSVKGLLDGVASDPAAQRRFLQTAYRRTGDMDMLLNRLFYLSKLESGNMPICLQRLEIGEFLSCYGQRKQEILKEREESLQVETGGILVHVSADPEELCRVFDNLVENSRKYSEAKPLCMKLVLMRTPKGVGIRFSDNGVGVPEAKLPFLFDEFYRVDESRNRKDGNGLGLYIVKYLMEAMGGSVRARNQGGLVIEMELPVKE